MAATDVSQQLRLWAHELAALARTGLDYSTNAFDRERYEHALRIAERIATLVIDGEFTLDRPYLGDLGYVTAKTSCSVAVFDAEGRVCLIERADNGRWALPGGFNDVGETPRENALREVREETGLDAEIEGLVGVYDNRRFNARAPYHIYTLCFRGRVTGGVPTPSIETTEVRFFGPSELPEDMSDMQRTMARDAARAEAAAVYQ